MKQILLTGLLVVATQAAFAQGKVVLANDSTRLVYMEAGAGPEGYPVVSRDVAISANLVVDLYVGTTAENLIYSGITATTWSASNPGQWDPVNGILPFGFPGGNTQKYWFQILVHPSDLFGPLLQSQVFQAYVSSSLAYNNLTVTGSPTFSTWAPGVHPVTGAAPGSLGAIGIVPEPSSGALFGIGLAASLLHFLRRGMPRD